MFLLTYSTGIDHEKENIMPYLYLIIDCANCDSWIFVCPPKMF
uniref:Macaca fascicularis brain cDNA, clone: QtrA-16528 n=1 Tax=Macaca fascicularis TaxID=9541 RepID=I7GNM8_MACFA|nr:unnamed protein product [Macaca fascicularis]